MSGRLANAIEGVPERFVPAEMRGQLVEAEHMARYRWAAAFCQGRRVLDAGCGVGYGAGLLKRAGATEVVAVDLSEAVIDVARQGTPKGVLCDVADVRSLPYDEDSFDLAVCFEVIEHIEEQDRVLDQLVRILRPDGLLLISSPNRDHYVPGNPHHRHEYIPSELRVALEQRFKAVRLMSQHTMLASVIDSPQEPQFHHAHVERLVEPGKDDEIYTLAIAGSKLPDIPPPLVALTQFVEIRQWLERYHDQDRVLQEQARALRELETMRRERGEALDLLASRELSLTEVPVLRERLTEAKAALVPLEQQIAEIQANRDRALARTAQIMEEMTSSLSWRLTAPLRGLKRWGRSLFGFVRS